MRCAPWLHLLGTEPAGFCVAEESHLRAAASASTAREKGHVAAIGALLAGDWRGAGRMLEDVTLAHPHDGLALLAGHQVDFFTGDARMLRDRVARALPAWDEGRPGYHALLGMHAFGLEETGHYAAAERAGRRGVERAGRTADDQSSVRREQAPACWGLLSAGASGRKFRRPTGGILRCH